MRLASLHTYPVKGFHRVDHDDAQVEPWGLAGDRRWMVVDPDGVGVTQREAPVMARLRPVAIPGGIRLHSAGLPPLDLLEPDAGPSLDVRVFRAKAALPARAAGPAADDWVSEVLDRKARMVWLDDPVDGCWVFRFPRREIAVAGVRREMPVLPRLTTCLPLPVPVPELAGERSLPSRLFGGQA